jgi:hypothetical protein
MKEPLGDKLLWIATGIFLAIIALGWIILLTIILLKLLFPKSEEKLEKVLQKFGTLIGEIQKYSIYTIIILLLLRLIAGWLGWAQPLSLSQL